MKRTLSLLLLLGLLLCACGGGTKETPYSTDQAEAILTSGAFEGSDMAQLELSVAAMLYGIDASTLTGGVCYLAANTSVSADELAILIFRDEAAAQTGAEALQKRVQSQIAVCESYAPAAVPRLEQAVIRQQGATVLYAVGDPEVLGKLEQ